MIQKDVIVAKFHAKAKEGTLAGPCPLTIAVAGLLKNNTPIVTTDPAGNPHFATQIRGLK